MHRRRTAVVALVALVWSVGIVVPAAIAGERADAATGTTAGWVSDVAQYPYRTLTDVRAIPDDHAVYVTATAATAGGPLHFAFVFDPPSGSTLERAVYRDVHETATVAHPGLMISSELGACTGGTGVFVVDDVDVRGGEVHSFSARFHMGCAGQAQHSGQISFRSQAAYRVRTIGTYVPAGASLFTGFEAEFFTVLVGTTSAVRRVEVSNHGPAPLRIAWARLIGPDAAQFAVAEDQCSGTTLTAGQRCLVGVTFTPTGTGLREATLSIADTVSIHGYAMRFSGHGTLSATRSITTSPTTTVKFGSHPVGSDEVDRPAVLYNAGSTPLALRNIRFDGTDRGDFSFTTTCRSSLLAAGTCVVRLRFRPRAPGVRTASLLVRHNDNDSPRIVALSGRGT